MNPLRWLKRDHDIWEGATFLKKWGLVGVLIGIGSGLGAMALIVFVGMAAAAISVPRLVPKTASPGAQVTAGGPATAAPAP